MDIFLSLKYLSFKLNTFLSMQDPSSFFLATKESHSPLKVLIKGKVMVRKNFGPRAFRKEQTLF